MYGSGVEFKAGGAAFAEQLLDMYKQALGDWAYPIVAIAALTTMFSTTLTLLDAFPRTIGMSLELIAPRQFQHRKNKSIYIFWLLVTIAGTLFLLFFFTPSMGEMVKVATIVAFVAAPVLAILNTMVMFDKSIPESYRPGKIMLVWCMLGLTALIGCSMGYLMLM
jgi:amino acid transporter